MGEKRNRLIVALSGTKGCGKSTVARFLVQQHGFKRLSYASRGRQILKAVGLSDVDFLPENQEDPIVPIQTTLDSPLKPWVSSLFYEALIPNTIVNDTTPGRLCTKVLDALQISVPTKGFASWVLPLSRESAKSRDNNRVEL
jgi:ABC-type dipeptide/oligopeptide/nickel transport system ATPase subunit